MLAGAQKQVGNVVVGDELFIGHVAGEMDVGQFELFDQMIERRQVAFEETEHADDQQSRTRIESGVVGVKGSDQVFDLLVGDDPADKQDIGPVIVELPGDERIGGEIEVMEPGHDREYRGPRKAEGNKVLAVEL